MTMLPEMPQGCSCAACRSAAANESFSLNYIPVTAATISSANSLFSGYRWGSDTSGITLTYKFFTALPAYYSSLSQEASGFQAFTSQMKDAVGRILDQLETFTKITFLETTEANNQIGFAQTSLPVGTGAWAYYPSAHPLGGDVWTNKIYAATTTPVEGNYGFYTLMHEIGHALGLQHSFTAGLTGDEASSRYSVMAYDWSPFFSSSYMVYDIAALQTIYGANTNYHTGNDTYAVNGGLAYTLWDAGGVDTLDARELQSSVVLDLREGEYSSVGLTRNIGIAFGVTIERAQGGNGDDTLIGNSTNNTLAGNSGHDTLYGGAGGDILYGGEGNDILSGDDGNDKLEGNNGDDTLYGGAGRDVLTGGNGNDILASGLGEDTLLGGLGRDVFVFDNLSGIDTLNDYGKNEDILDISALLTQYDPVTESINDFLRLASSTKSTYLRVDANGTTDGTNFVDIAVVNDLRGEDITSLIEAGLIITA